ncbi:MAG TPA: ribonuclease P protein component [Nitrospirota bacterium]|nr:ribonuclease P protein component [Nitrospirota bacterium]
MTPFLSNSKYKICKGWEYRLIYRNGRRRANRHFVLYYIKNNLGYSRFGISVSRKLGGAVKRNRIKRIIREIVRLREDARCMGVDMVIVARGGMTGVNFKEANEVFGTLIKYMEH